MNVKRNGRGGVKGKCLGLSDITVCTGSLCAQAMFSMYFNPSLKSSGGHQVLLKPLRN